MSNWHLDKRVPIATIATLAIQAVGFTAWIAWQSAVMNARVAKLEEQQAYASSVTGAWRVDARLSVLESQMGQVLKSLERVEDRLTARPSYAPGPPG